MIGFFTKEERVGYGKALETLVLPKIQAFLGEDVQECEYEFSLLDFSGKSSWAELKVRTQDYFYTDKKIQQEGWIIPACKFLDANWKISQGKSVFFFYLWVRDGSLWMFKYKPEFMNIFPLAIPENHKENQLHYYVAQEFWTQVDTLQMKDIYFKKKHCMIEDEA